VLSPNDTLGRSIITAVQAAGFGTLDQNQRLNYELETGRNGRVSAVALSAAD